MRYDINDVTSPALRARLNGGTQMTIGEPSVPAAKPVTGTMPLPKGTIGVAVTEHGRPFGIDLTSLLAGRLLIQGNSGAGKSWLLRKILEESAGQIQQIIIDPDSEFRSLGELLDYPIAEGHHLDLEGAAQLADRVRQQRLSMILDLGQIDRAQQMIIVSHFLTALIASEHWHPAIVAIDEAQLFAPLGGQGFEGPHVRKASVAAVVDLMSRGRKRGLAGIVATQRLARLSKSVVAEIINYMIGINTLDLDVRRAAETIGWDARRAFDRLPMLTPGNFVAVGPAFTASPQIVTVGQVRSRHLGSAPLLSPPKTTGAAASSTSLGLAELAEQADASRDDTSLPAGAMAVRKFIRDPAFSLAGRIFDELKKLYPQGAMVEELAFHLGSNPKKTSKAVTLLTEFAVLEVRGDLAVRVRADFAKEAK
jgi:hypothetical protein